jgi:hypothetical protein
LDKREVPFVVAGSAVVNAEGLLCALAGDTDDPAEGFATTRESRRPTGRATSASLDATAVLWTAACRLNRRACSQEQEVVTGDWILECFAKKVAFDQDLNTRRRDARAVTTLK